MYLTTTSRTFILLSCYDRMTILPPHCKRNLRGTKSDWTLTIMKGIKMSMNAKIITALFLSIISTNTFAATEILKPTPDMKEIARISLSEKITNPAGMKIKFGRKQIHYKGITIR